MAEDFGVGAGRVFYEEAGAIRDVIQNHLLQILVNLAMEPPAGTDSESVRDEKAKVLKEIAPLRPENPIRGQFAGVTSKKRWVAPDSKVETFAALKLEINSWRWHGVPFYLRAGKELPVTCTEVLVQFRRPPAVYSATQPPPKLLCDSGISPDVQIAPGRNGQAAQRRHGCGCRETELPAVHQPGSEEMDAYERLLGEALKGDATLFAREDYVERAWSIVDPVLKAGTPIFRYEPKSWGPREVDQSLSPEGGWHNPTVTE